MTATVRLYSHLKSVSEGSTGPEVPVGCGQGSGTMRRRPCHARPCRALARDLPETALHAPRAAPTPRSSTVASTCAVVEAHQALCGVVNPSRFDGKEKPEAILLVR